MSSAPVTAEEWRSNMLPHFTATMEQLEKRLADETDRVAAVLGLERPLFLLSSRIKAADRAAATAARRTIDYWKLPDWVALRVSCPTPEAAYHLSLSFNSLPDWKPGKRFDYNLNPKLNGYRGVHVYGNVTRGGTAIECELQVHTRLQTLWSDLTHENIYKPAVKTSHLAKDTATNLAAYMAATDQLVARMIRILHDPEAQMRPSESADTHNWIAALALLYPGLKSDDVDVAIASMRAHGLHADEQLQWLLERWERQFERLHRDVVTRWRAAGCREPTAVNALAVAARFVAYSRRQSAKEEATLLERWATEQADFEQREVGGPVEDDHV
jgi:ppGpp synthetase/RelA/SpoT-type nucleotidyltranferase